MKPFRFAVLTSRFNEEVTGRLRDNCLKTLRARGVPASRVLTVEVPGAYELPWAAQELAASGRFDAVICLGAVLKGQTPQNDFISQAVITHLQRISLDTRVPCILGVITPRTWAQAVARTKGEFDRGREAALAALEMAELRRAKPWRRG